MADDGHSSSSSTSASAAPAINNSVAPGTGAESSDAATSAAAAPDAPAPAIVTVNIKTLNGPDFELAVARNVLVSELKTKVRERTDVEEVRSSSLNRITEILSRIKYGNRRERIILCTCDLWCGRPFFFNEKTPDFFQTKLIWVRRSRVGLECVKCVK